MHIFYIDDLTDKEIIYFDTIQEVYDYTSFWNHDMVIYRRKTPYTWEAFEYIEREDQS